MRRSLHALILACATTLAGCTTVNTVQVQRSDEQQAVGNPAGPPCCVVARPVAVVSRPPPQVNPAALLTAADVGELPRLHQHVTGSIAFLGRDTPLPSGDWEVIMVAKVSNPRGLPNADVMLLRRDGGTLTGMFEIKGNVVGRPATSGFAVSGVCTMGDTIFSDVRSAELGGAQDCLAIVFQHTVHWRAASAPRIMQALARDIDIAGAALPPTLISAAFEVRNRNYQLYEQVWLNPDTAGIGGDHSARRSDSDWTAYNLSRDPERQQYIDTLRQWADGWRGVMEALVGGRTPQLTAADRALP